MLNKGGEQGNQGPREQGTVCERFVQKSNVILSDRSPQDGESRRICGCFFAEWTSISSAREGTIE